MFSNINFTLIYGCFYRKKNCCSMSAIMRMLFAVGKIIKKLVNENMIN